MLKKSPLDWYQLSSASPAGIPGYFFAVAVWPAADGSSGGGRDGVGRVVAQEAEECAFGAAKLGAVATGMDTAKQGREHVAVGVGVRLKVFRQGTLVVQKSVAPSFGLVVFVYCLGVISRKVRHACTNGRFIFAAKQLAYQQHLPATGAVTGESLVVGNRLQQLLGQRQCKQLIPVQVGELQSEVCGGMRPAFAG